MEKKKVHSDFLFARPSVTSGLARMFDFAGSFDDYNHSATEDEADAKAIFADWAVVGDSIRSAMEQEQDEEAADEKAA